MSDTAGEIPTLEKKDDGYLAVAILVFAAVLVITIVLYLWRVKKIFGSKDKSWKQSSFTPPPERAAYLSAKERLNVSKVSDLDELKKLLMKRAIQTIPILLSLQNEGSSIERLYKRGMLTDDMHFKVKELKAFVDQEFQDIQFEADDLVEGWGQHIWPQSMQFHQMILKQTEAKNEELKKAEEEKKKSESQKRKEKERAKKAAGTKGESGTAVEEPVVELSKEEEAEKMAMLLLEEEEREQKKIAKSTAAKKK